MKVSIIVPCYKVESYLPTCIESILNQSYKDWELILVDDGSPDCSGEICDNYAQKDNRIKVIHKPNGGLSDARNVGLDLITGEYVTFLDSDDFLHENYLKILMNFIVEDKVEIAQCGFVRGKDSIFPIVDTTTKVCYYDNHSVFTEQVANIVLWGKIYKASFFYNVRMPVGKIHEDDWTTWKLYYQAKKIAITSQSLYYYTINPNGIMGQNKKKIDFTYFGAYEERIKFFVESGEKDLEDVSRMQFCKSLLMLYSNPTLNSKEKIFIKKFFLENWSHIKSSPYVANNLKVIFKSFSLFPSFTSMCIRFIRK